MLLVTALTLTGCGNIDNPLEEIQGSSSSPTPEPPAFNAKATPLTLEFTEAGEITFCNKAYNPVYYKINDGETLTIPKTSSGDGTVVSVSAGDIVSFFADNNDYYPSNHSNIKCTANCYIYGNIMSLINSTDFENATELTEEGVFYRLFSDNAKIKNDPSRELVLPATTLTNKCYEYMFEGCTGLTKTPELPATTLANSCYYGLFKDCTGLTQPSKLLATNLAPSCYAFMFSGCSDLASAPELSALIMKGSCYQAMFQKCTSLTTAPKLPAGGTSGGELADMCYAAMFDGCTGLAIAPNLPATTLVQRCYSNMFKECTNLTTPPALPSTELKNECYWGMFWGCSSLTTAPELPATTLAKDCYNQMFRGCSSLNYVKILATDVSASNCLSYWLYLTSATGTIVFNDAVTINDNDNRTTTTVTTGGETLTRGDGNLCLPNNWTAKKVSDL